LCRYAARLKEFLSVYDDDDQDGDFLCRYAARLMEYLSAYDDQNGDFLCRYAARPDSRSNLACFDAGPPSACNILNFQPNRWGIHYFSLQDYKKMATSV
jgi:hypothetical protein